MQVEIYSMMTKFNHQQPVTEFLNHIGT